MNGSIHIDPIANETMPSPNGVAIRSEMSAAVHKAFTVGNNRGSGEDQIVRIDVPIGRVDTLLWLNAQSGNVKWFWSGRHETLAVAGLGVADRCSGESPGVFEEVRRHLDQRLRTSDPRARYYGGIRFDESQAPSEEWRQFGSFQFILPRFELTVNEQVSSLACHLLLPRDSEHMEEILTEIEQLSFPERSDFETLPFPVSRKNCPDIEDWEEIIEASLRAIDDGHLEKVVLARRAIYDFSRVVNPLALLCRLQQATPNCFHFFFQPALNNAFLGATPERLFRREGKVISSEAVAGTRPRSLNASYDAQLGSDLLQSEKDQREHAFVRRSIHDTLGPLCTSLNVDACASEMKLANGRHLVSAVKGTLRSNVTTLQLLAGLHPTPAVGGVPRETAEDAISRLEPFDRGWYAGPIGWIGVDSAEFAVALRCGLVQENRLSLYSGAGIVAGSVPSSEWAEVEHKIMDFVNVLGFDVQRTQ